MTFDHDTICFVADGYQQNLIIEGKDDESKDDGCFHDKTEKNQR